MQKSASKILINHTTTHNCPFSKKHFIISSLIKLFYAFKWYNIRLLKLLTSPSHVFGSGRSSSDVELSLVSPGELVVPWARPAVVVSVVLTMGGAMMWVTPMVSPVTMRPAPSVRAHLGGHGVGVAVAPTWSLPLSAPGWAGVASRAVCSLNIIGWVTCGGDHGAVAITRNLPCWAPGNKMKYIKI